MLPINASILTRASASGPVEYVFTASELHVHPTSPASRLCKYVDDAYLSVPAIPTRDQYLKWSNTYLIGHLPWRREHFRTRYVNFITWIYFLFYSALNVNVKQMIAFLTAKRCYFILRSRVRTHHDVVILQQLHVEFFTIKMIKELRKAVKISQRYSQI